MSTLRGDTVAALVAAIQGLGTPYNTWTFLKHRPAFHDADGSYCAVYFSDDVMDPQHNTGGGGPSAPASAEMVEFYEIQYWEPAPDEERLAVDDSVAATVEGYFDAVRGVVFSNEAGLGGAYQLQYDSGALDSGPARNEGMVRGFGIRLHARRRNAFSTTP